MTRVLLALVPALLLAGPAAAQSYTPGVSGQAGLLVPMNAYPGGLTGVPFLGLGLESRQLFADHVALEFGGLLGFPLSGQMSAGHKLVARVGWNHEFFTVLAGPLVELAPDTAAPLSILPSLTITAGHKDLRGVFGLFDRYGLAPLRLGVEFGAFGVAYLPALGLEASVKWPLQPGLTLDGRVLAFNLFQYTFASALVGVSWTPGGAP